MLYTKGFIKAALALTAIASASSAMAVNATALLNTALLTANSITVASLGSASYDSTAGALSLAEQAATSALPTLADFAAADGFKATVSGAALNFTDFQFNNAGSLTGKFSAFGGFYSFDGSLLQASTLVNSPSGLVATNFAASAAFSNYLINTANLSPATVGILGSLLTSMTTPGLTVTPVPEPSTYALMGLGLVGISLVARRRRQAA